MTFTRYTTTLGLVMVLAGTMAGCADDDKKDCNDACGKLESCKISPDT